MGAWLLFILDFIYVDSCVYIFIRILYNMEEQSTQSLLLKLQEELKKNIHKLKAFINKKRTENNCYTGTGISHILKLEFTKKNANNIL